MTKPDSVPEVFVRYEDHVRDLRERKAARWAKILAAEPPGRVAGRRKRSADKEALLLLLDRARIARAK